MTRYATKLRRLWAWAKGRLAKAKRQWAFKAALRRLWAWARKAKRQWAFEKALRRCNTVAREEYPFAQNGFDGAENLVLKLQDQMPTIEVGAANRQGTATQEAREQLAVLSRQLDRMITDELERASDSLSKKKDSLEKFTVTLFGRTMTGKSTIREAITQGDGNTIGKGGQRTTRDSKPLFRSSRDRLRSAMKGLVSQAVADMTMYGDGVAEGIEPGSTEDSVEVRHEQAQKHVQERCDQLREAAGEAVVAELKDLERQLETLDQGNLAQMLRARGGAEYDPGVSRSEYSNDRSNASTAMPSDWSARLQKVGNIANHLGKYAATWTTGPFAQAARLGSATAARGSQAHRVIYNVGKFLNVKFKPWGAVNVAKYIGNAGRVLGAIGGVLGIVVHIYDEEQQAEHKRQLRDARDSVRQNYRDAIREIETEFWATYEAFSRDFYHGELKAIDKLRDDLVGQRRARTDTANSLGQIASDTQALIQNIQADAS